jgi:Phosphoesterase family
VDGEVVVEREPSPKLGRANRKTRNTSARAVVEAYDFRQYSASTLVAGTPRPIAIRRSTTVWEGTMSTTSIYRRAPAYCPVLVVAAVLGGGVATSALADRVSATEVAKTATPIKHVVVVIGENRSFDHVYATYVPQGGQAVLNLLSEGIVQADGSPGPNFAAARQFTTTAHNHYFVGVGKARKTRYNTLPPPTLGGAPNAQSAALPPFFDNLLPLLALVEPSLEPTDLPLLTTGATGATVTSGAPDTRITNYAALPNGPFQLTGPTLPYDSYTGDTVHQFYQMWQQSDCRIQNATEDNPTGCLSDLYSFVATTFAGPQADEGGGTSMAFYNMQTGDAPLLKSLADEYTLSDNHHQPAQGGSAIQHIFVGSGDDIFWSDGNGNPTVPPASQIANPNPKPGTNNQYTLDGRYSNCSDLAVPGVLPILRYVDSLPYETSANCALGHYYMLNNTSPGFLPNGRLDAAGIAMVHRSRRAMFGRSATPLTKEASPGPITPAPTVLQSILPTARRTRWMQSVKLTAVTAISLLTLRRLWETRRSDRSTSRILRISMPRSQRVHCRLCHLLSPTRLSMVIRKPRNSVSLRRC